jgi:hypothetical protein
VRCFAEEQSLRRARHWCFLERKFELKLGMFGGKMGLAVGIGSRTMHWTSCGEKEGVG